jgi:hypothetical protein
MAEAKDNLVTKGFSGTIGRQLTFRIRGGKTIVSKLLIPNGAPPSEKAAAVRAKFQSSSLYAKKAIKDPATKALYKAAATGGQSAFNLALGDAFKAPVISKIITDNYHGAVGNTLLVDASDDFKVTGVVVSIHNAAGDLIETGNAVIQENEDWLYTATQVNAALAGSKITAVASDLPGNNTSFTVTL